MKIKYNIPMLNKLKEASNKIKNKISKNKEKKIPLKYYTLLVVMLIVGVISFASNYKVYNSINKENYTKYELNDDIIVDSNKVENIMYETAISSISTNISNIDEGINNQQPSNEIDEFIWPVKGKIIKEYSMDSLVYSKTLNMWQTHAGIDIEANFGDEVKAVEKGTVIEVSNNSLYGNSIKIEHKDGYISMYSNLEEIKYLKEGDIVSKGEVIGNIGNSAIAEIEDESHLHFEVLKNNQKINPIEILE